MKLDPKDFDGKFVDLVLSIGKDVDNLIKHHGKSKEDAHIEGCQKFYRSLKEEGQLFRINNLYRCKDKGTKKKVWFRPNPLQAYYYKRMTTRDLILKPRQIGFTQFTIIIGMDNCLFEEGSSEGLMAHLREKAGDLFERVRDTLDWFIEDWGIFMPVEQAQDSSKKITIQKCAGYSLKTSYEVSHDFRSSSLTRLHVSEASRVDVDRGMGSMNSVPHGGQIILETTASGRDEFFYAKYVETKDAKRKKDVYVWENHFYPWFHHYPEPGQELHIEGKLHLDEKEMLLMTLGASERSILWRRWKIKESFSKDPEMFDEEYPTDDETCFLGGFSVLGRKSLLRLQRYLKPPALIGTLVPKERWFEFADRETGPVYVWERPREGEQYVIGADPSEGVGKDRAAAFVKKRSNGAYVAKVQSAYLPPEEFAEILYMLARWYSSAFICFELNNHGHVLKDRLVNTYKYAALYRRREVDKMDNTWKDEVGFRTTGGVLGTKEKLVMGFVSRVREGKVAFFDEDLFTECINFQRDESGRLGAVSGSHDDLFMAACLAEEMDDAMGPMILDEDIQELEIDPLTGFPI